MSVVPFVPSKSDNAGLVEYHRLKIAASRVDRPEDPEQTFEATTGWLFTPLPYFGPCRYWAFRHDGRMVGLMTVGFPEDENQRLAVCDLVVHPEARSRGVGTALLTAVISTVQQRERRIIMFQGVTEGSTGDNWARERGFAVVHRDYLQRLDLVATDPARWEAPVRDGYRIQRWVGAVPEELVASYARVRTAIGDQPQHDWSVQWPEWTPERVRREEEDLRKQGIELMVVAAVQEATGTVAGVTEIMLYPHRPERAIQGYTAVLPEHRGHGLGRVVKATMMRWLRAERPRVTEAMASNADDNRYMVDINRQLGYQVRRRMVSLEIPVAELASRLGA